MIRSIPQEATDFIGEHEACVLRVYDDARPGVHLRAGDLIKGTLTAGYGHTKDIQIGMDVSFAKARAWLDDDIGGAALELGDVVDQAAIEELTPYQYAALLSFVFNVGCDAAWTIWKRLNKRQFDQVPLELMKFVNATVDGQKVKVEGLVNRRAAEVSLWSTNEPGSSAVPVTSASMRQAETPPTPSDPVPASKSKALIFSSAGAIVAAGPMVDQVRHTIEPYTQHSNYVQNVYGILTAVAAALAAVGLFYMWLQKRNARN